MNKHLLLILLGFGLIGCSVQEDTRLICDCVKATFNSGADTFSVCMDADGENAGNYSNKSLVFNQSKNLFVFNGTTMGEMFTSIEDNFITYRFEGDTQKTTRIFDRVSLTMLEVLQDRDYSFENKVWDYYRTYSYQCRRVEGV